MLLRPTLLGAAAGLLVVHPLRAQDVTLPAARPAVRAALETIRRDNAWTLEQQRTICEIPAPPFGEAARAAELARRFRALGLANVRIDSVGNVIGERAGSGRGPTVVLSGHLDTVFPEGTDVSVTVEGTRMRGPGIGDDCRGLAVVLAAARALEAAKVRTDGTILFVGTVGEEGAGNLRGVRHLFGSELKGKVDYFISVDGTGFEVTSGAVGSNRYSVTYHGPGGHSYGAFGMPNPTHALGRAIAKIADLRVPANPKTTFNVGVIEGGTSVNSIAGEASMDIDMRSESAASLDSLDRRVRAALDAALEEERARWPASSRPLEMRIDTIGLRPAGQQPDTARIVRVALAAAQALGKTSRTGTSSTDANVPIALGIPAITIDGGGSGGGSHSLGEWYDDGADGWAGAQWAALIAAALAGVRSPARARPVRRAASSRRAGRARPRERTHGRDETRRRCIDVMQRTGASRASSASGAIERRPPRLPERGPRRALGRGARRTRDAARGRAGSTYGAARPEPLARDRWTGVSSCRWRASPPSSPCCS